MAGPPEHDTSSLPLPGQVVKVKPNDKDAKMKYQECSKIVKQKAFERAIAGDEHRRSVVDSLDIESMSEWPGHIPHPIYSSLSHLVGKGVVPEDIGECRCHHSC